jgi:hypothetical protein
MGKITVFYNGDTTPPDSAGRYAVTVDIAADTNFTEATKLALDTFTIAPATLTVTPDSGQGKMCGDSDTVLTFTVSGWQGADESNSARIIIGALSRVPGDTVGTYAITDDTLRLSPSAGGNYTIRFTSGVPFTIIANPKMVHPDSIRINGAPVYIADNDTIYYTLPCGDDGDTIEIMYRDTSSQPQTLRKDSLSASAFPFDTVITVLTKEGSQKSCTVRVNRSYGLFDFVTEHLERIRIVVNNPAVNGGFEFTSCEWRYRKAGEGWRSANLPPTQFYYVAGPSIAYKFNPEDSMYVVLYTTAGDSITTCPDATPSRGIAANADGKGDAEKGNYAYPNPVRSGGKIYLKQSIITEGDGTDKDKDKERYSTYRLFNSMGRLVASGSASVLIGGLTMPEVGGLYFLVLDGKAGRRVFQIAVV